MAPSKVCLDNPASRARSATSWIVSFDQSISISGRGPDSASPRHRSRISTHHDRNFPEVAHGRSHLLSSAPLVLSGDHVGAVPAPAGPPPDASFFPLSYAKAMTSFWPAPFAR